MDFDLEKKKSSLCALMNSVDSFLLRKSLDKNVENCCKQVISTHKKKLQNLTKNSSLPFTHRDTVTNLSSHVFTDTKLDLLKNGLDFAVRPPSLNKADIFTTFESIH